MTEKRAIASIKRVMDKHPRLTREGFLDFIHHRYETSRAALLDPDSVAEFLRARDFLSDCNIRKTINRAWGTSASSFARAAEKDCGVYISTGAVIAAAVSLGAKVQRIEYMANAWLSIGRRWGTCLVRRRRTSISLRSDAPHKPVNDAPVLDG